MLKALITKNGWARKPPGGGHLSDGDVGVGQRKACELVGIARSSFRYSSKKNERELRHQLLPQLSVIHFTYQNRIRTPCPTSREISLPTAAMTAAA